MDYKVLVLIVLSNYLVAAFHNEDENIEDYYDSNEYQNTLLDEFIEKNEPTKRPIAKYEVTEILIDIPDDRTKGPIVNNFTISRPLNLVPNTTELINNINNNTYEVVDSNNEGKKNYISILHVKAEIDDKNDKNNVDQNNGNFVNSVKDYLLGIKKGIINGFNSIIHKKKKTDFDEEFDLHKPLSFFNKLHL